MDSWTLNHLREWIMGTLTDNPQIASAVERQIVEFFKSLDDADYGHWLNRGWSAVADHLNLWSIRCDDSYPSPNRSL